MRGAERRPFVVVSGLPASGKTTLGRQLAQALGLPLLDKDDILDALFESAGEVDRAVRQRLSRMSDDVLEKIAIASHGAVIVSFWRHESTGGTAGTPTAWLSSLPGALVEVHCVCPPEIAERRFRERQRHPGHKDGDRSGLIEQFQALAERGRLGVGAAVVVRTDEPYELADVLEKIREHVES